MKLSFYYGTYIPVLLSANTKHTDDLTDILRKLDRVNVNANTVSKVKYFLKKYWLFEKKTLKDAFQLNAKLKAEIKACCNCAEGQEQPMIQDPALVNPNSTIIRTPDQKYMLFEDTYFYLCPQCQGRLYPQFRCCPYCGNGIANQNVQPINVAPNQPKLNNNMQPFRVPDVQKIPIAPKIDQQPRRISLKENLNQILSAVDGGSNGIFLNDGEVIVSVREIQDVLRNIHKYIPTAQK